MKYYLGVDMGTSSMKATLIDEHGTVAWANSRATGILNPAEGIYEADSEHVWWGNFLSLCASLGAAGFARDVAAVCVSSICATFIPADTHLRPLGNAVLYGIDRRAADIANELNERYGHDFLVDRLGGLFSTQSVLPKLIWFKRHEPEIYNKTTAFIPSYNAVNSRLTGRCAWDAPTAFGALMLEMSTLDHPRWLLEDYQLDAEKLPPVKSGLSLLGPLTNEAATATGLPADIPVCTGTGDINAEAMSAGAIDADTAVFALGSTTSMLLNLRKPARLPGYMPGVSLKDGVWRIGAASSCGGLFTDWARERFGAAPVPAEPTGIFCLPYLGGARSPFNNPSARGGIFGLSTATAPADLTAAAWETIAYDVALLLDHARPAGTFPEKIHISGGLCRVPGLPQLIADITNTPLLVTASRDASFGSALIALGAANGGNYPTVALDAEIFPDPNRAARYAPLRKKYIELCDALAGNTTK